ncbi:TPA: TraR/DksA C4-type zinc finger protein [Salmonella enterica]
MEFLNQIQLSRISSATHQPSATHCCDCSAPIPERRREAVPGVSRCVDCQSILEYFPHLT